ncbi:hypothetical protein FB451DRAFT_650782 [Mycena latifolia]|nr:hypothetical protein FB451DRAFT_650782 [Mycena latifolia]
MYLLFLPVAAFILAIFACRFLAPSPLTYSRLGQATLFPVVKCGSANTKTASYNPRTYSPDPPRFVYNDPSVGYDALARYGNVLNALEMQRRVCPPQTLDSWRPVLKHLEKIKYHDERWVDTLLDHITSFLMPLVEDILPGELEYQYPELSEGQQGGRNIVVEMEHPRINHGIAEESKCTPVLNKLYGDITCPMVLPNGKLEEEKAVMVKIGLQLQKLRTRVPTARHGLILSGTDCYVVELCQTTVGGTVFPGLAVSNRIALSPSSEDDSPVQSLATLVLGLIIPPTVLPYALPRDPSSRADRKTIEAGLKALIARGGANGAGGGGAVGGGGSGGAGDQEGPSGVPPALKLGSAVVQCA